MFSTTITWWGRDKPLGDMWSPGKACLAQVEHPCTLTRQRSELRFMGCGFAMGWWSPAELARAPGALRWYPYPCRSRSPALSPWAGGGHNVLICHPIPTVWAGTSMK